MAVETMEVLLNRVAATADCTLRPAAGQPIVTEPHLLPDDLLADDLNGDYFTIDLSHGRLGRCYDSFWDSHAQVGDCKIVAESFTDFLMRMLDNAGHHWYFLQSGFVSLGDAYDGYS